MKNLSMPSKALKEFQKIPGVGKSIANDFWALGLTSIADLKGQSAEKLYEDLQQMAGQKICRCMLYVFRCAIYYASEELHEPDKLKWWYWKD